MSADSLRDTIYNAICDHSWTNGRCACGWTKPPHSVGHKHHLAELAADAIRSDEPDDV